jgi:teichuronic acid biosynthesis glycosyltransferase TuaG
LNENLVSIVTPAYNASKFVAATIESVQAQTYAEWEMLIVDDCSKDDTVAVVERYAKDDARVKLIRHRTNGGPAQARETAVDAATGRFIAFLDADDLWMPAKLTHQLAFIGAHGAAFSFTEFRRIEADGRTVGRLIPVPDRLDYRALLKNTAIATSTVVLDRAKTGPFRMTRTYYDDYALWLEITRRGFAALGMHEDLMRYRVLGSSVSRNKARSARMVWRLYREVEHLPVAHAAWCFLHYAARAYRKYRSF